MNRKKGLADDATFFTETTTSKFQVLSENIIANSNYTDNTLEYNSCPDSDACLYTVLLSQKKYHHKNFVKGVVMVLNMFQNANMCPSLKICTGVH